MDFRYSASDAVECLPEGEYDAELTKCELKTSKAGNQMLEVTWTIAQNGKPWHIRDYIVAPSSVYKLKQIARAWSMLGDFDNETFVLTEHIGKLIRLILGIKKSDEYGDQNNVRGFRPPSIHAKPIDKDLANGIPF